MTLSVVRLGRIAQTEEDLLQEILRGYARLTDVVQRMSPCPPGNFSTWSNADKMHYQDRSERVSRELQRLDDLFETYDTARRVADDAQHELQQTGTPSIVALFRKMRGNNRPPGMAMAMIRSSAGDAMDSVRIRLPFYGRRGA